MQCNSYAPCILQTAAAEANRLQALLAESSKNANAQAQRLAETTRKLSAADKEAVAARQKAANLQMDYARSLEKQGPGHTLLNAKLQQSLQRQQELEEELRARDFEVGT